MSFEIARQRLTRRCVALIGAGTAVIGSCDRVAVNGMVFPEEPEPDVASVNKVRVRRLSPRTEQAYRGWIVRFIRHHGTRHPRDLAEPEVAAFLTHLATERQVSASLVSA